MTSAKLSAPRALVVGTGVGCRIHVPALQSAGFDVVGMVGANAARTVERAAANGVPESFTDLSEAIRRTGAVAVSISSPPDSHAELVLEAISLGCHVICEKPFALNIAEARTMLDAANRAGIVHLVGHEFRWAPDRNMLKRVVAEGMIGAPRFLTFTQMIHHAGRPDVELPDWWFDESAGGGWLGAAGSHLVDWVRDWVGEFSSVSASLARLSAPAQEGAEDSFMVRFSLANGVEGTMTQTAGAWGPPVDVTRLAGTNGTVWLEKGEIWVANRDGARAIPIAPDLQLPPLPPASKDPRQQSAKWQMLTPLELGPFSKLCEAFRTLIEGGALPDTARIPTFADGLASVEILEAIRMSAANGGALVTIGQ